MKSLVNMTGDSLFGQFVKFQTAPTSGTAAQPVVDAGTQVGTPVATMGFGAREDADATRQAQHVEANDTPIDVNPNAVVARSQTLTFDIAGKEFTSNSDLREKMADANTDWREIHKGRLFGAKKDA